MNLSYKTFPHNSEAERAVLGAAMLSKDALSSALEILKPDDFYDINNKIAYEIFVEMYAADKPVDLVTVSEEMKARGVFDRLGGQPFLADLISDITITANVVYHAEIVREHAVRRKLIEAGNKIISLAFQIDKPTEGIIEEIEKLIFDAALNKSSPDFRHVKEIISPVFANVEERFNKSGELVAGYPTEFTDLNGYTGGFQPGSLNIIAARPSMGKTAFALNIAQFGGKENNIPVLIFSLEMPAEQLVLRMLAAESETDLSKLNKGTLDTADFQKVRKACDVLARRDIYINDDSALTAIEFRARCRRFKTKYPNLGLIIVDYLQLMNTGTNNANSGRQQEVAEISRILKAVARELNCPVIALSQLSRAAEQRTEKKPQLSDLRDSGAIEQDADVVMLMFREDYYSDDEQNPEQDSKADIRVAKNRNGRTGVFNLTFRRECTRFFSYGNY
ncbi:MAG: replicative DNA helicase [Synergistales bacterium]|nr:replicative DNA helicase [Synergistales bacterium]MDY6400970.1 replicative DNA helicase [Synergistales bacterium]MDY6404884.1 replicative DNA helicase [Synergistales bacterium]MDY6411101.1 replicative DNA helicase [Synergistales bacterium]MDY6414871.1 replicative DNA helicase [Synergistales bacterium]